MRALLQQLLLSAGEVLFFLREQLLRAARWLFNHVIEPVVVRLHVHGVFEAAGFVEIDEPDFTLDPIPTHRASLASAIAALQQRVDATPPDELIDRRLASMSLLSALLAQEPPLPEAREDAPVADAWASIDTRGLLGL